MRVAVVGPTGLIGRALSEALIARGDAVVALSRGGRVADRRGRRGRAWDPAEDRCPRTPSTGLTRWSTWPACPIAGKRWTDSRKEAIRESRTRTTRLVVDALARDGAPRVLVSGSAVGYYGTGEDEVDETSPPGEDFLAEPALAWEREAARAHEFGVRVVTVRTGIVPGQGRAAPCRSWPGR